MKKAKSKAVKTVLLVGAFANGNLGDMYQADAIAYELKAVDPKVKVFSASPSKRTSSYPAAFHEVVDPSTLFTPEKLNSYDLILVGGGGLLAAPHAPLHNVDWVKTIKTRLCAVSLGCAGDAVIEARTFVERCDLFSVRDEFSLAAVSAIRTDADIVMDPIFLGDFLPKPKPPSNEERRGVTWIPSKLIDGTKAFYETIKKDAYNRSSDRLISFNEVTDINSGIIDLFNDKFAYPKDFESFSQICSASAYSVTERYHGCILSLRCHVPSFGLVLRSEHVTSKIRQLYKRLDLADCLIEKDSGVDRRDLRALAKERFDFARIDAYIVSERGILRDYLRKCLMI